ncbi:MAG: glycerophosphoryl diester phosphodiesterase [Phycisphaerales bacterium]|nr:glycerophosphoryl diester phosphodiesterase [Phycisphaerales bacterium]
MRHAFFESSRPLVYAHRGGGALAPENTIAAFELGWKLNCVPEADVRTTKDGVIVAFHDNNFARVVVGVTPELAKKGIKDITFAELQKLDVGEGQHVLKMSEIFALMTDKPQRRMYLDIKQVDFEQLAKEVRAAKIEGQVTLASSKHAEIKQWKALIPESQTLLWIGSTSDEGLEKKLEPVRAENYAGVTQVQIHTHLREDVAIKRDQPNLFKESDDYLRARGEEFRERGLLYQTLPYGKGAESPEVYWKLLDLGFMSFATDHPDVTWDVVKKYYADGKGK